MKTPILVLEKKLNNFFFLYKKEVVSFARLKKLTKYPEFYSKKYLDFYDSIDYYLVVSRDHANNLLLNSESFNNPNFISFDKDIVLKTIGTSNVQELISYFLNCNLPEINLEIYNKKVPAKTVKELLLSIILKDVKELFENLSKYNIELCINSMSINNNLSKNENYYLGCKLPINVDITICGKPEKSIDLYEELDGHTTVKDHNGLLSPTLFDIELCKGLYLGSKNESLDEIIEKINKDLNRVKKVETREFKQEIINQLNKDPTYYNILIEKNEPKIDLLNLEISNLYYRSFFPLLSVKTGISGLKTFNRLLTAEDKIKGFSKLKTRHDMLNNISERYNNLYKIYKVELETFIEELCCAGSFNIPPTLLANPNSLFSSVEFCNYSMSYDIIENKFLRKEGVYDSSFLHGQSGIFSIVNIYRKYYDKKYSEGGLSYTMFLYLTTTAILNSIKSYLTIFSSLYNFTALPYSSCLSIKNDYVKVKHDIQFTMLSFSFSQNDKRFLPFKNSVPPIEIIETERV